MSEITDIWVFSGNNSINGFPSGLFSSKELAEKWIKNYQLSGTLTKYPIDKSIYDWAIDNDFFVPKNDFQKNAKAIVNFNSAYLEHYHYENGS